MNNGFLYVFVILNVYRDKNESKETNVVTFKRIFWLGYLPVSHPLVCPVAINGFIIDLYNIIIFILYLYNFKIECPRLHIEYINFEYLIRQQCPD